MATELNEKSALRSVIEICGTVNFSSYNQMKDCIVACLEIAETAVSSIELPSVKECVGTEGVYRWDTLREKYFKECTYKPESGLVMTQHSMPPHDVFRWFEQQLKSSIGEETEGQDELVDCLAKALQGLVDDVRGKPNDTRYTTHLKIADTALEFYNTLIKK